jgi:lipoprotein-anchoring transpeptidase ErfK/SrfK
VIRPSRCRSTWLVAGLVTAVALSGCSAASAGKPGTGAAGTSSATVEGASIDSRPSAAPTPQPSPSAGVQVVFSPAADSIGVRPDQPVRVDVTGGSLTSVTVTPSQGKPLAGAMDAASASWRNTDALVGGTSYIMAVTATGADGGTVSSSASFRTLQPSSTVSSTIIPGDDWDVGVGMPVVVTFARPVQNREAAVAALSVTSTPAVAGAWRWMSKTEVHWRPKEYWPSGTKVFVKAATSGVELAPGAWGRRTVTSSFRIGRARIDTVDVAAHTLTVREGGQVVRTIPVTSGKPGFQTRNGIKVIMSRESEVRMDAATTGTDPKDPNYYNILVHNALRLTYSGEFLHAAPWSVYAQGRVNVSHGCTGMSNANAQWLFDSSKVGDVVVFTGSSRPLEWGNGYTVWNKAFDQWASGA